jgi:4-amino-4-deoxy-L-arabinose transferase-like glycosyltransferase
VEQTPVSVMKRTSAGEIEMISVNHTREVAIRWLILVGIALYLTIFLFNSLSRTRLFSPDSMNYVDVARNIATGKGVVQSTLGFNQPLICDGSSKIPTPFTAQAPLYPFLIVILSRFVSYADAALILPVVGYGIILFVAFFLTRDLYGERSALLALAGLLVYAPLSYVSRYAWTESVGTAFLFLALFLLVKSCEVIRLKSIIISSLLAGLATGLAFSTRYALFPLFFLGALFYVIECHDKKLRFGLLLLYTIGAILPVILVVTHNYFSSGGLLPPALPSDQNLKVNLGAAFLSTFGNYSWKGTWQLRAALALALAVFCVATLIIRRKSRELLVVFVRDRRYLLTSWFLGYSAFMVCSRTVRWFDIDGRTMVHAGVVMILLGAALVAKVYESQFPSKYAYYAVLTLAVLLVCAREIRLATNLPVVTTDMNIAQSERLTWIAQHTTDNDLVIGENAQDIPFYFAREAAVSFAAYPYSLHLTYEALEEFVRPNCDKYQHIYLILQPRDDKKWNYDEHLYRYGQFITDTRLGNITQYPDIRTIIHLKDADVFQVCPSSRR